MWNIHILKSFYDTKFKKKTSVSLISHSKNNAGKLKNVRSESVPKHKSCCYKKSLNRKNTEKSVLCVPRMSRKANINSEEKSQITARIAKKRVIEIGMKGFSSVGIKNLNKVVP